MFILFADFTTNLFIYILPYPVGHNKYTPLGHDDLPMMVTTLLCGKRSLKRFLSSALSSLFIEVERTYGQDYQMYKFISDKPMKDSVHVNLLNQVLRNFPILNEY